MADKTLIEWCDASWNVITGCTPIPDEPGNPSGCSRCYARRMANRLRGRFGYPEDDPFRPGTLHLDKLHDPDGWKKPRRIFVSSMGDLFHEQVRGRDINQVWNIAFNNPRHTFMFLTKRPERALEWTMRAARAKYWPVEDIWPDWMWLGVTAENQKRANERIPILLQIPAAVRFVSIEPMLGPVDIDQGLRGYPRQVSEREYVTREMALDAEEPSLEGELLSEERWEQTCSPIDWVIVGAETGPRKRPMKTEWALDVRDQCESAGVPFFFKKDSLGKHTLDGKTYEQFPAPLH